MNKLEQQLTILTTHVTSSEENINVALSIATSLRVIFHQTPKSHSLVDQLGIRNSVQISSKFPRIEDEIRNSFGDPCLTDEATRQIPFVHDPCSQLDMEGVSTSCPDRIEFVTIDDWWANHLICAHNLERFNRRSLVLTLANKAGGSHVDPNPNDRDDLIDKGIWEGYHSAFYRVVVCFAEEVLESSDLLAVAAR